MNLDGLGRSPGCQRSRAEAVLGHWGLQLGKWKWSDLPVPAFVSVFNDHRRVRFENFSAKIAKGNRSFQA